MEPSISLEHRSFWKLSGRKKTPYSIDDINVLHHRLREANIQRTKDKINEMLKGSDKKKLLPKIKSLRTYLHYLQFNKSNHRPLHRPPNAVDPQSSKLPSQISWPHQIWD